MEVSGTIGVNGDGVPKQAPPPPSPVTGCYLLIVVGEPHSEEHKEIILQRIAKGLLSWDVDACQVDLEKELQTITGVAPEGEETRHGERLIQFASENLVTEILIHPATSTLIQCMKNLLSSFTRHRHIIHSGYTFAGNGSWALQDGTFSLADFSEAFQEIEVQRVLRAYENTISIDIHCSAEGDWTRLPKEQFTKFCKLHVNPVDVLSTGPSINTFLNYISPYLVPAEIENLLESSDVVGNIRFSYPTLYVFPGGQGDAALFGINGFNMLVDGGFARKACFWDFTRHLDRLDAVLMTRINNTNVSGICSVLRRKVNNQVYPQIGHFFCNLQERKAISPDGDKDKDPLLINLLEEGHEIVTNLKQLNLRPQICYRDTEPINLYHKVGHGTLDMYVLSPAKDSKEVKEYIQKWNMNDQKLFGSKKDAKDFIFPLQNMVSICALLVWQPASPTDTITRLLFPGSTPHNKIFEGLDRLKHLEFMKHPVCTAKTLTPSGSILGLKSRPAKGFTVLDKIPPTEKSNKVSDNKQQKEKTPPISENKAKQEKQTTPTENKNKITNGTATTNGNVTDKVTKRDSVESEKSDPTSDAKKSIENDTKTLTTENKSETKEIKKDNDKPKAEPKPKITSKTRSESLARKAQEKKPKPIEKKTEQKPSPKKAVDTKVTNGVDKTAKPKFVSKTASATKSSPTSTPAKSTKDANNRKVIESKKAAPKKEAPKDASTKLPVEKKEAAKVERKPISRRPKPSSPGRSTKTTESPVKKIVPKDKNGVSRTIKLDKEGTTDSSAVSTPSADQDTLKKLDESKLTKTEIDELRAKELADLKEEQEVVKEIEAVFQKDEEKKAVKDQTDLRKIKDMSSLEGKTTEPEDEEEEYIIIEKEEVEQYTEDSINEAASVAKGEDEIQKHKRDSEESEKPKVEQEKPTEVETKQPELFKADTCEVLEIVSPKEGEAPIPPEMTRSKEDSHKTEEMSKEVSVTSPEDKYTSSEKKTTDTRDEIEEEVEEGLGEEVKTSQGKQPQESQPEEKYSTTVESGATTAPTLPEDERIPLDDIKEDIVDQVEEEEKYIKEETKEKEQVPVVVVPQKVDPPKMEPVAGMKFDAHQQHIRDIVKTPDEVADLPVHEEVDFYDYKKEEVKKTEDHKDDKDGPSKPEEVQPKEKEEVKTTEEHKELPKEEHVDHHKEEQLKEHKVDTVPKIEEVKKKVSHEEVHAHVTEIHEATQDIQKVTNDELEKELVVEASTSQVNKEDHIKHDLHKTEEDTNKLEDQKEDKEKVIPSPLEIDDNEKADIQKEEKSSKETTPEKVEAPETSDLDEAKPKSPTTPPQDVTAVVSELFQDKLSHVLPTDEEQDHHTVQETDEGSPSESKLDLDSKTTEHADEKDLDDDYVPALRREVDIAKIVTSVAHVLKSDAPLEELASEIPHEFSPYHSSSYGIKSYTTELRETHITTVDSPLSESRNILQDNKEVDTNKVEEEKPASAKETTQEFLEKEQQEASKDVEEPTPRSKASDLIRDSNILMKSSSKMLSGIKSSPEKEETPEDIDNDPGIVHRMLVTASSEDGGEEIEICPKGTIIFQKSDNSGKSTPECGHSPRLPPHDDIFNQAFEQKGKHLEEVAEALLDAKEKADEEQPEKDVLRSGKSTPAPVRSGKSSPDLEKNYEKFMEQHPHVNDIPPEEYPNVDRKDSTKTISESLDGSKRPSVDTTPEESEDEEGKIHRKEHNLETQVGQVNSLSDKLEQMKKKVSELDELLAKDDGDEADEIYELSPKVSPESVMKDMLETKIKEQTHDSLLELASQQDTKETLEKIVGPTVSVVTGTIIPEAKVDESAVAKHSMGYHSMSPELTEIHEIKVEREKSGKSTPDIKEPERKSSLEVKEISGRETSDHKDTSELKIAPISSGRVTPDLTVEDFDDEKHEVRILSGAGSPNIYAAQTEEKFPETSGKSSPEHKDEDKQIEVNSGKASPDHKEDSKQIEVHSGKATPNLKEEMSGKASPEVVEDKGETVQIVSGDTADDVKIISGVSSGRATPDVEAHEKKQSENSSPVLDEKISGKSSPEVAEHGLGTVPIVSGVTVDGVKIISGVSSGRATSDIEASEVNETEKSSPVFDEKVDEKISGKTTSEVIEDKGETVQIVSGVTADDVKIISGVSSGRVTPEPDDKPSAKSSPEKIESVNIFSGVTANDVKIISGVSSGRATPDHVNDSGKATPNLKQSEPETEIISGKSSPDIHIEEKSGKSSPEHHKESVNIVSGVTLDNAKIISGVSSGRGRPESAQATSEVDSKHSVKSGKSTPEIPHHDVQEKSPVLSGKATPTIAHHEVHDTTLELSEKATPEVDSKHHEVHELPSVLSGKATPEVPHYEVHEQSSVLSGKATSEFSHELEHEKSPSAIPVVKDTSGKTTPNPIQEHLSGKATPEAKVVTDTGKVTPDVHDEIKSRKSTPHDELEIHSQDSIPIVSRITAGNVKIISGVSSGKATPESASVDVLSPVKLSGKSTPDIKDDHSPPEVGKDRELRKESLGLDVKLSGKSTPDTKEDHHIPDPGSRKESLLSNLSDHHADEFYDHYDSRMPQEFSGHSTPEPELKFSEKSEKSTPDIKGDKVIFEKNTPEPLQIERSPVLTQHLPSELEPTSSKATPQKSSEPSTVTIALSGKTTPEVHHQELLEESSALSGKVTPIEPKLSGKSTPDVSHEVHEKTSVLSGKETPEVPHHDDIHEKSSIFSGKATPEVESILSEKSRKSTPDILQHKVHDQTSALSGKVTPEVESKLNEKSGKSTPEIPHNEVHDKSSVLSGKATLEVDSKLPEMSEVLHHEHHNKSPALSGKETPIEPKLSGKSTPDVSHEDHEKILPENATPEVPHHDVLEKSTVLSGKATPEVGIKLGGKSTPEISHHDVHDTLSVLSGKATTEMESKLGEKSGKSTPEVSHHHDQSRKATPEVDTMLTEKSSPEIPHHDESPAVSEKATPVEPKLRGKSTPEVPHNVHEKTSILSGKSTPDVHHHEVHEPKLSGKSASEIPHEVHEKTSDLSRKATPEEAKTIDKSGKSTPDIKASETGASSTIQEKVPSGKATPEVHDIHVKSTTLTESVESEDIVKIISGVTASQINIITGVTGSTTPTPLEGRQSPEHKDIHEVKDEITGVKCELKSEYYMDHLHSAELTPEVEHPLSGKTTPDVKVFCDDHKFDSDKSSPEKTESSGKSSPDLHEGFGINIVSGVTSSNIKIITGVSSTFADSLSSDSKKGRIPDSTKSTETSSLSIAGPSTQVSTDSVVNKEIAKLSTEDLHLSGKSTPDIADVERWKEQHEILKHEKHIPGSSTPPTVPVSPIVKEFMHSEEKMEVVKENLSEKTIKEEILCSSTSDKSETILGSPKEEVSKITTTVIDSGEITTSVTTIKTSELRCPTPGSDDEVGVSSPHSDISSGQMSRAAHPWGHESSEERQADSEDDEVPESPMSSSSKRAHSPPIEFENEEDTAHGITHKTITVQDPMNTSFYGALPDEHYEIAAHKTDEMVQSSCSKSEKRFHDDADLDFDIAMKEHRLARGSDLVPKTSYKFESKHEIYTNGKSDMEDMNVLQMHEISDNGIDPLEHASPLKTKMTDSPKKVVTDVMTSSFIQESSTSSHQSHQPSSSSDTKKDPLETWGKPLGLPSPALPPTEISERNVQTTPKKMPFSANSLASNKNKYNDERKRSESPLKYGDKKNKKVNPVYMDLCYVPHHGNSYYSAVDFFKRIRARYYVFSGTEPSKEVYNALLEAKQTWEDKELEVTIIPTYDTDVLGYWVAENEDLLAKCKIDLSPSASRCTINLQDHETSCSAYRLEF